MLITELYLIRHGIAAERGTYAHDHERPLTEQGQHKTRTIAKRLKALDMRFDLILTSPLIRAQQTAQILQSVGLSTSLKITPELAPEGRFEGWLQWLRQWQQSEHTALALVGHEPDLSSWAEKLIWGEVKQRLILKKAGVIGLKVPQADLAIGHSQLFWLTAPKFFIL
ncbi:MAG: phosphohistidine phosphatase SixA [Cyanothece sp. SIO1E1]|nr:phosphohistidine phosphatase SixA [Cyanothece sp. SIO1E1]